MMKYSTNANGLRGFAAINVVLAHFIAAFYPSLLSRNYKVFQDADTTTFLETLMQFPFISIFYNGHFAVIVFFVLSGYVLSMPAFENNKNSLKKRLLGRYLRLNIPVAFILIVSYIFLTAGFYYNTEAAELSGSKWLINFFTEEKTIIELFKMMLYESIVFGERYLYSPLWTIQIEFIGSLYLLVYFLIKPYRLKTHLEVYLLLGVFVLIYFIHGINSIYFYAMILGAYLNLYNNISKNFQIIFMILGIYFGSFQFTHFMYDFLPEITLEQIIIFDKKTFYNTLGALFMVLPVVNGLFHGLFSSKLGRFLGKISYSSYLIHFIILCSITSYIYILLPKSFLLINFILYIGMVFMIAKYLMQPIDNYSIHISHKFAQYIISSKIYKSKGTV